MSLGERANTPLRTLCSLITLALATTLQFDPFQCSIRVWSLGLMWDVPTAHISVGDRAAADARLLFPAPTLGLDTTSHLSQHPVGVKVGVLVGGRVGVCVGEGVTVLVAVIVGVSVLVKVGVIVGVRVRVKV